MKIASLAALAAAGILIMACCSEKVSDRDRNRDETNKKSSKELAEERRDPSNARENSTESDGESETEDQPDSGDVGEDCVQFLRATTAAPAKSTADGCPTCTANGAGPEVLKMGDVKVDGYSSAGDICKVAVTIHATFNPSHGGNIVGGLTSRISPQQKAQYARGETPPGRQTYHVTVTYRRTAKGWQPVEFN